jgi:hypothetical protein
MNLFSKSMLTASVIFMSASSGSAQVIESIPNYSFEQYSNAGNAYANQTPPGNPNPTGILFNNWETTAANYQIFQNPVSNLASPGTTQGTYYADESIPFGTVVTAEMENPFTDIQNNYAYTLTVALGVETGKTSGNMTIELLSGNTVLAFSNISGATLDLNAGTFADYSTKLSTYNGNDSGYIGQPLSVAIITTPTAGNQDGEFDNVRVGAVPEPSTYALMLGGLAFLGLWLRRRNVSLRA